MKRIKIWMLLLSVIMFQLGHSQSWVQQDKITASDRQVEANFGGKNFLKPVSIYGDIAVVGAAQNNHSGLVNAGAVYIYERTSAGDWVELQKITASDAQANANFGASVAISEYEDFIVVGAPRQHQPLLGGGELVDSGAAYIFKKTFLGWVEHLKILPEYADREANGYYGQSIDITSRRILVGSLDDGDATLPILNGAGAAYLFERTGGSGSPIDWVLKQKITPANRNAFDLFGTSVSISQNIAVIGAAGNDFDENEANEIEDSGAAYIFEKPTVAPVWLEVKKLTSTDRNANEFFGVNVNIDNYFIIAGAPGDNLDANGSNPLIQSGSAFVYHKNTVTGVWSLQNKLVPSDRNSNDSFGHAVEISSEGLLVVGSIFEDHNATGTMTMNNAGSAYISKYNSLSQTWSEEQKIVASDRAVDDRFGSGVAISDDTIIVTATREDHDENGSNFILDAGSAYIYEYDTPTPLTSYTQSSTPLSISKEFHFACTPNPAKNNTWIRLSNYQENDNYIMTIYDYSGKEVLRDRITNGIHHIDLGKLKTSGLYIIKINNGHFTGYSKLLKTE